MDTEQKKEENVMEMESNWEETIETFDELNLKKDLLRGKNITKYNYLIIQEFMVTVLKNHHQSNKRPSFLLFKEKIPSLKPNQVLVKPPLLPLVLYNL